MRVCVYVCICVYVYMFVCVIGIRAKVGYGNVSHQRGKECWSGVYVGSVSGCVRVMCCRCYVMGLRLYVEREKETL
jgi:hypothetical protein